MKNIINGVIDYVYEFTKSFKGNDEDVVKEDGVEKKESVTDEDIEKIIKRSIKVYEKSDDIDSLSTEYAEDYYDQMDDDFSEYKDKSEERVNAVLNKEEHLVGLNDLEKAGSIKSWNTNFNERENAYEVLIRFYDGNELHISLKNRMIRFESEVESNRNYYGDQKLYDLDAEGGMENEEG